MKVGKKLEYKVITGESMSKELAIEELETEVNKLLQKGWKAQGGVSINKIGSASCHIFTIAQAMVYEG